jgi:hypothetical protein
MWDTIADVFTSCFQDAAMKGAEKGADVVVEKVGK